MYHCLYTGSFQRKSNNNRTTTGKNSKNYQNIYRNWKAYATQPDGFFKIADLRSVFLRFTMGVNPFHKEYFYSYDSSRAMRFKENLIADRRILHASFKRVNLPFHYIMT